jgi:hypothetical protein
METRGTMYSMPVVTWPGIRILWIRGLVDAPIYKSYIDSSVFRFMMDPLSDKHRDNHDCPFPKITQHFSRVPPISSRGRH